MTIIKFTVDVFGDDIDQLVIAAEKEALAFYKPLPGKFRAKDISITYDAEYYENRVQHAIDEAQAKADAYKETHKDEEDFEDLEVVPASVPRYSGWIEFEYDTNQAPVKKTSNDILSEQSAGEADYNGPPEQNPKYQDKF